MRYTACALLAALAAMRRAALALCTCFRHALRQGQHRFARPCLPSISQPQSTQVGVLGLPRRSDAGAGATQVCAGHASVWWPFPSVVTSTHSRRVQTGQAR